MFRTTMQILWTLLWRPSLTRLPITSTTTWRSLLKLAGINATRKACAMGNSPNMTVTSCHIYAHQKVLEDCGLVSVFELNLGTVEIGTRSVRSHIDDTPLSQGAHRSGACEEVDGRTHASSPGQMRYLLGNKW